MFICINVSSDIAGNTLCIKRVNLIKMMMEPGHLVSNVESKYLFTRIQRSTFTSS